MNASVKKRWVEALRSGEYKQGSCALRKHILGQDQYCCLGVLCDLYAKAVPNAAGRWDRVVPDSVIPFCMVDTDGTEHWQHEVLTPAVREWAGLNSDDPVLSFAFKCLPVSALNDEERLDFHAIARIIEEQL